MCIMISLVGASLACGQTASTAPASSSSSDPAKKDSTQPAKKDEPAPLFGGKLGVKSSQKNKESATLGFNGIDPSGKVDAKMLATSATSAHEAKVKEMATLRPQPAALDAFIKDGGLSKP